MFPANSAISFSYSNLLKLCYCEIRCLPGHKFQLCCTTKKSRFLYLRLYFAVVSAIAVKSSDPSSFLDVFFVRSLSWQTEKVPGAMNSGHNIQHATKIAEEN